MKYLIPILAILLFSCSNKKEKTESNSKVPAKSEITEDIEKDTVYFKMEKAVIFTYSDFFNKVFTLAEKGFVYKDCKFDLGCDCCSSDLVFNEDSTFYQVDYCVENNSISFGKYTLNDSCLFLHFNGKTRNLSEVYLDDKSTKLEIKDTLSNSYSISLTTRLFCSKIVLTSKENDEIGLDEMRNYNETISRLEKDKFLDLQ